MKNTAERIIFSSFNKAIQRHRGPFYFLCVKFANNDLTRCSSSHVDTASRLSSLRPPFPLSRLFIVTLGNERKPSKTVSGQYGCWDLGQSATTRDALIVTSSVCAAVKLKGSLCVWGVGADEGGRDVSGSGRDFDAWRPLLGHNVCENTKAALSEHCEKSGNSEVGDLWPQVFATSTKASVVWGYRIKNGLRSGLTHIKRAISWHIVCLSMVMASAVCHSCHRCQFTSQSVKMCQRKTKVPCRTIVVMCQTTRGMLVPC